MFGFAQGMHDPIRRAAASIVIKDLITAAEQVAATRESPA
jgi:hypothetical protein